MTKEKEALKRIRTKDGVYEVVGFDEECIIPSPLIKVKNNYGEEKITHCCKDDIIAQSENLEELCDVYAVPRFQHIFKIDKFSKNAVENYAKGKDKGIVYGAIWTDKGLIYVAKMDENGEFELI